MSTTTWGWLVLAFPLAGTLISAFGYRRRLPIDVDELRELQG